MKIYRVLVPLLILLAGYTYADSRVRGYETEDCSGSYLEAGSYSELKEWHNQTDSFGNTWHFESFIYVKDEDKCHDFDMATIVVKGTRLPKNPGKDKWSVTDDDSWRYDKYGFAEYGDNNVKNFEINVAMHGINMGNTAKLHGISFRHMLIYWHLHELVHVMQAEHERNDGDDQYIPPTDNKYDKFIRELEAINGVDEIWRKLFGEDFDPPFLMPEHLFDYQEKRNRVSELLEKQAAGTLSENEEKELENLQLELYELHHGELPKAEVNKDYKNKKLEHCVGKAK